MEAPVDNNLVGAISQLLAKHNHPHPTAWEARVHPDALTAPDVLIRRFLINRFWHHEIGQYNEDTLRVRHCLIDQGSVEDWLRLFEQGVIPCILRNTVAIH